MKPHFFVSHPCTADWDAMQAAPGGRFCELCQKTVLDASDGNTTQLQQAWESSGGKVCARLPKPQFVLHPLQRPRRFPRLQKAAMILLAAIGLQQSPAIAQESQVSFGKVAVVSDSIEAHLRFTGQVIEHSSKDPLEGAQVVLMRGEELLAGAMADSAGRFQLLVPEKDVSRKDRLTLKVKYFDHVFIQEGIKPKGRHLMIELNAEIWMKEVEIAGYRPQKLGSPVTGRLMMIPRTSSEHWYHNAPPFQRYPSLEEWMLMNLSEVKAVPK